MNGGRKLWCTSGVMVEVNVVGGYDGGECGRDL